jgi:hypothetical protein
MTQFSHLDAMQGKVEQRTEAYEKYVEGVAETLTPQCAKSDGKLAGFAWYVDGAVGGLW